jgi:hypothetical protein
MKQPRLFIILKMIRLQFQVTIKAFLCHQFKTLSLGDYTAGIAVHWYESGAPFSVLTRVHNIKPDKFILATEACNSYDRKDQIPYFGRWLSAELYVRFFYQRLEQCSF